MSASWFLIATALGASAALAAPKALDAPGDPKLVSIHPFTAERGAASIVTIRGTGLRAATTVFLENAPFTATIDGTEPTDKTGKTPQDAIRLRIQVDANAKPGRYPFRLVTPAGISNALQFHILDLPVAAEPAGSHE